ncbi:MAG TPA: gas vesicle protein K [Nitrosopumilaceae archaeon]|nr:gas vesicle protein K [Nitrosopumilaceae archaeon]
MGNFSKSHKTELVNVEKINLDGQKLQNGLGKLVLTLVEILRQILERQAQRRIESGTLTSEETERLGLAFMQTRQKIREISKVFGCSAEELDLNLGSLIKSGNASLDKISIVDVVDKLLDKGVMVTGQVTISVADVDLIALNLLATLSSIPSKKNKSVKTIDMVSND